MKLLLLITLLLSCGPKKGLDYHELKKDQFDPIVNQMDTPAQPDLGAVKTILNRDYPIEIAIFKDGQWYYDLPNLGDGKGTWKYEDGRLKLFARRNIFDMEIEVVGADADAQELAIKFVDRFGHQIMPVEKITNNK
jgi:hypothetical protein